MNKHHMLREIAMAPALEVGYSYHFISVKVSTSHKRTHPKALSPSAYVLLLEKGIERGYGAKGEN